MTPPFFLDQDSAFDDPRRQSVELVAALHGEGKQLLASGRTGDAENRFARGLEISRRLLLDNPDESACRLLTECLHGLLDAARSRGELAGQLETVGRMIEDLDALPPITAATWAHRCRARCLVLLGESLHELSVLKPARRAFVEALVVSRQLCDLETHRDDWDHASRSLRGLEEIDLGGRPGTTTNIVFPEDMLVPKPTSNPAEMPPAPAPDPGVPSIEDPEHWYEIRENDSATPSRTDRGGLERLVQFGVVQPAHQYRSSEQPDWKPLAELAGLIWPKKTTRSSWVELARQMRGTVPRIHLAGGVYGSGFVAREDGLVVTNRHVIEGHSAAWIQFLSGTCRSALLRRSNRTDLALLKTHDRVIELDHPMSIASGRSELASEVMAIGYPAGLHGEPTLTKGIVSAYREYAYDGEGYPSQVWLQHDAPIGGGNSGGPLIDATGAIIGVNTFGIETYGDRPYEGLGFAVTAEELRSFLEQAYADIENGILKIPSAEVVAGLFS